MVGHGRFQWYGIKHASPITAHNTQVFIHLHIQANESFICAHIFLTHWGRVMHICIGKLASIGSDNGLLPDRHQAIIWTNAEILLIGPMGTNFSEILIEIYIFSFKKMNLKMSSGNWKPFCLGLNVLNNSLCLWFQVSCAISQCDRYHQVMFLFWSVLWCSSRAISPVYLSDPWIYLR